MNLRKFRQLTRDLPGDTELVFWDDEDATWYEANSHQLIVATPIHPYPVLVLDMGQQVELEHDLAVRTGIDEG